MSVVLANEAPSLTLGGSELGGAQDIYKALIFSTGSFGGALSSVSLGLNPPGSTTVGGAGYVAVPPQFTGSVSLSLWSTQYQPGTGYVPLAPISTSPLYQVPIQARSQLYTFSSFNPWLDANTTYAFALSSDSTGLKWANVDADSRPQGIEGYQYLSSMDDTNTRGWAIASAEKNAIRMDVALQPGLVLIGNAEPNWILGSTQNDLVEGMGGKDTLAGMQGDDRLEGGSQEDWLYGARGNDTLNGGDGGDVLTGGYGDDWLDGFTGDDRLTGGVGADRFVLSVGLDVATDFSIADGDLVLVPPSFAYSLTQIGSDLLLEVANQGALLLLGVDQQQFQAAAPVQTV